MDDLVAGLIHFLTDTRPLKKNPGPRSRSKYEKYTLKQEAAMIHRQERSGQLIIDCDDLGEFDDSGELDISLLDLLDERPALFRDAMIEALDQLLNNKKKKNRNRVYPVFLNVPAVDTKLDTLRSHNVSEIIEVTAQVVAIERNTPHALEKAFRCLKNHHVFTIPAGLWAQGAKPNKCLGSANCEGGGFQYVEDESVMFDVQWVKLKEQIEPLKKEEDDEIKVDKDEIAWDEQEEEDSGTPPMDVVLTYGLVGVPLNSIIKLYAIPRVKLPEGRETQVRFYLEAIGYEIIEDKGLVITDAEIKSFKAAAAKGEEEILRIIRSMAPWIHGRGMVKRFMALQQVAISPPKIPGRSWTRYRLHGALFGDPGTAKSQLLRFQAELAHIGVYASGEGASGVGLSAAVIKDEDTGRRYLESGALPRANGGIACVDEISAIKREDFNRVKNGLESEEIPIDKWGLTKKLACHTSLFGAANPKQDRFREDLTPHSQIDLQSSMEDRFDVIFAIKDKPGTDADAVFGQAIIDKFCMDLPESQRELELYEMDWLRKFYYWTGHNIHPTFPLEIRKLLVEHYVRERRVSHQDIVFNNRDIEAIMRLALAEATLRHAKEVERVDLDRALDLYCAARASLHHIVYDPEMIDTFTPGSIDSIEKDILDEIERLAALSTDGCATEFEIAEELSNHRGVESKVIYSHIITLVKKRVLIDEGGGRLRRVR